MQCVSIGLIFGIIIFMADLYFIVRTDLVPPNYSKNKPQGKSKATPYAKAEGEAKADGGKQKED